MKSIKGKYLALGFENCDVMYIPLDKIRWFNLDDISKNISYANDHIHKFKSCKSFAVSINSDFLKEPWYDFDFNDDKKDKLSEGTYEDRLLNHLDIVDVCIVNKKGSVIESPFYVAWGTDEYTNEYEKIGYDKNGNLFIEICDPKDPDHYKETIEQSGVKFVVEVKDDSNTGTEGH